MKHPKISVLIPVYNTGIFLDTCLNSVIQQSLKDIEIIVVNDGSTDDSRELLSRWKKKDPRICTVDKHENEGLLLARKTAVELATGEYIVFLDSDDYFVNQDALKIIFKAIKDKNVDFLQFSVKLVNYDGSQELELPPPFEPLSIDIKTPEKIMQAILGENRLFSWALWNKIYKKELIKSAYNNTLNEYVVGAEDAYAMFLIAMQSHSFSSVKTAPLIAYRQGSGSSKSVPEGDLSLDEFKTYCDEINVCGYLNDFIYSIESRELYLKINEEMADRLLNTEYSRLFMLKDSDLKDGVLILINKFNKETVVNKIKRGIVQGKKLKIKCLMCKILKTITFGSFRKSCDKKILKNQIIVRKLKFLTQIVNEI